MFFSISQNFTILSFISFAAFLLNDKSNMSDVYNFSESNKYAVLPAIT
ncbi:MAG: hypothetical protein Q8S84_01045 [bacterium]|nr:hypothetical protein [bacterium]